MCAFLYSNAEKHIETAKQFLCQQNIVVRNILLCDKSQLLLFCEVEYAF